MLLKETFTIIKASLFFHSFLKEQLVHLKKGTISILQFFNLPSLVGWLAGWLAS
jgi:hypothetical protein